jgi:hypothetical protein
MVPRTPVQVPEGTLLGSPHFSRNHGRYQPHTDHTDTEPLVATFVVTARKN